MRPTEPLQLHHSWAILDAGRRLDGGWLGDVAGTADPAVPDGAAAWSCRLADQGLDWSDAVYDLFGLPHRAAVTRAETLALYAEDSRAALERLRGYAIRHRRGFTLDARIRPAGAGERWMRISAMPVCEGREVVRLHGVKRDVSHEYR